MISCRYINTSQHMLTAANSPFEHMEPDMLVAVAIRWWDGLVSAQLVCCRVLMGPAVCNTLALWRLSMCASQTALLTNFC